MPWIPEDTCTDAGCCGSELGSGYSKSYTKGLNSTRQMTGVTSTDSGFSPFPQHFSLRDHGRALEAGAEAGLGCSR